MVRTQRIYCISANISSLSLLPPPAYHEGNSPIDEGRKEQYALFLPSTPNPWLWCLPGRGRLSIQSSCYPQALCCRTYMFQKIAAKQFQLLSMQSLLTGRNSSKGMAGWEYWSPIGFNHLACSALHQFHSRRDKLKNKTKQGLSSLIIKIIEASHETLYIIIPLMWNDYNRQIYIERRWISGW